MVSNLVQVVFFSYACEKKGGMHLHTFNIAAWVEQVFDCLTAFDLTGVLDHDLDGGVDPAGQLGSVQPPLAIRDAHLLVQFLH